MLPADSRDFPVDLSHGQLVAALAPGIFPDGLVGRESLPVTLELERTFRVPTDLRDLGLSFGTFEIR